MMWSEESFETRTRTTLGARVEHWSNTDPDTPAFIFVAPGWRRAVLTRADVYRLSSKFSARLQRMGIGQGDIVSNTLPNSPARLITHIGTLLCGAASMNGQVFLKDGEDFVSSLRHAGCVAVILNPRERNSAADLLHAREKQKNQSGEVVYPEMPLLRHVIEADLGIAGGESDDTLSWVEKLDREETETHHNRDVTPDDTAVVWTTSGSTGFSKLVPLSHHKVLLFHERYSTATALQPPDVFFNAAPLGWAGGSLTSYVIRGVTRVLPDFSRETPDDPFTFMWEVIEREKCTGAYLMPFFVEKFLQVYKKRSSEGDRDITEQQENPAWRLKVIFSGGQPLKRVHLQSLGTITERLHAGYGSTEAGLMAWGMVDPQTYTSCTVGPPAPDVEMKVIGDDGKKVALGELGEIFIRSPQAFTAYLNNEAATQKTISPDGWVETGDMGKMTAEGKVMVICRKSYSIMRGSYLLYPGWLEARIIQHPGLLSVLIVPVPDPNLHQELCACIVTQPGVTLSEEELKSWCEGLFLRDSRDQMTAVPRYFLFFDTLPTLSNGKVCRRTAAAMAKERLGLTEDD